MARLTKKVSEPTVYHTKITDWPLAERPREKLMMHGASTLSEAELIAILIRTGTGKATAVDLAKTLLKDFKSLGKLASRQFQELRQYKGLGDTKSVTLVAAFELGRRAASHQQSANKAQICSPEDVVRRYQSTWRDTQQEIFMVLLLDSANHLLNEVEITRGILNSSLVHPREVFKHAIIEPAASIILLHNHPSGNPEPSTEDIQITRQIVEAGKIIGIPIHDHIIIAGEKYTSFAERGLL